MKKNIIGEAIANIASTSDAIEKFSNDPNSRCSPYAANLLERMAWELHKLSTSSKRLTISMCRSHERNILETMERRARSSS